MNEIQLSALVVTGPDAMRFLQGQLTCDVLDATPENFIFGAHCNPQGRIISFFWLTGKDEKFYLTMPQEMVELTLTTLKKYAVFFKVTLAHEQAPEIITYSHHSDIEAGIPQIYANTSGKFLPHELNLQLLNALSFTKGCYTGQEIIARMHYRGQLKKHMYRGIIQTKKSIVPGDDIFCDDAQAGNIVDSTQSTNGIELLFVANANDVATKSFHLREDNTPVTILTLPYSFS